MTIDQLIYFIKVCENKSYTKTSKELYISQPAITTAIKNLEKELGTELFFINGRNLEITQSGDYLYTISKPIVSLFNNIDKQMKDFIFKSSRIKVGIPPMLGAFIFAPIFESFLNKFPNLHIQMFELASNANQKALSEGEIDLALTVIYKGNIDNSLTYKKIDETQLVFSVNKNHPFASKKEISIEELKDIPLILLKEDSLQYEVVTNLFKEKNITPNIRLLSDQIATIKELLSYGKIGAFLFNQVIKDGDDIVGIPLKENIVFDIIFATKKNVKLNNPAKELLEFAIDYKNFNKTN